MFPLFLLFSHTNNCRLRLHIHINLKRKDMTEEERKNVLAAIDGKDISEIMELLAVNGNRYSRRILRFFRWFCKWSPVVIMLFHAYGMWDFSHNPKEMFVVHDENGVCYAFIYFMLYVLPIVIILASRFFWLCWRYRIPFFYFFGVNAIHIAYWNWYTTNEMVMSHMALMVMVLAFYIYGAIDWFFNNTKIGRRVFL